MIVPDSRMEQALKYLAVTDRECADLKGDVERHTSAMESAYRIAYQNCDGTVDERKCKAKEVPQYHKHDMDRIEALIKFEAMRNKRTTATILVEVWRTEQANRRKGNI